MVIYDLSDTLFVISGNISMEIIIDKITFLEIQHCAYLGNSITFWKKYTMMEKAMSEIYCILK